MLSCECVAKSWWLLHSIKILLQSSDTRELIEPIVSSYKVTAIRSYNAPMIMARRSETSLRINSNKRETNSKNGFLLKYKQITRKRRGITSFVFSTVYVFINEIWSPTLLQKLMDLHLRYKIQNENKWDQINIVLSLWECFFYSH